jgi:hypothetical protein
VNQIWRIQLKPETSKNKTRSEILEFCRKNDSIGVGWGQISIRTHDYSELRTEIDAKDPKALKPLNAMWDMEIGDLIYTRLDGNYFLCRVTSKWSDTKLSNEHEDYGICNYVGARIIYIGREENVPGKVINCFRPASAVQRVKDVENISKLIWNNHSGDEFKYLEEPITIKDFWNSINSEDLEGLILLYLQSKGYYIYSTTLKRSTAVFECVMVSIDGSHKCYPQVKSGDEPLAGNDYELLLDNKSDKVFLFALSQNYYKSNNSQIEYLALADIEVFIRENKRILPEPVLHWVNLCSELN